MSTSLPRRDLRTSSGRSAARLRATFGADVARLRNDAGASLRALAREAGIDPSHLSAIEHGTSEPSLAAAAALASALGADVSFRLYPVTGPRIRDHLQTAMVVGLLRETDAGWERHLEVAVRRPARGFIDLVLARPEVLVAAEFHSEIRRFEQLVRWAAEKAASIPSADGWPDWSRRGTPTVSRLLVLRSTRHNRAVVGANELAVRSLYPGDSMAARRSLTRGDPWPGAAIVWMSVEGGRARLLERPPRL